MAFDPSLPERLAAVQIRSSENDVRYLETYALFVKFFSERIAVADLLLDDAKIGVVLVYTWMGRAQFDPKCWDNFERAKDALSAPEELNKRDIDAVKSFVGNSLIATSKFLHFLYPTHYAIWDSNVAWAGYRFKYPYEYNRSDRYLEYLTDLQNLSLDDTVGNQVRNAVGEVSSLRMKEFALFHLGISELSE